MAMSDVHSVCTRIHDLIQKSGLHFVINQTPWSSYITIRRKFVNEVEVNMKAREAFVTETEEVVVLRDTKKRLEDKLTNIEVEKVHLEEEFKASVEKHEKTVLNLLAKIDTLENVLEEKELDVKDKKSKIESLEKETNSKNDIIKNINSGFNKTVAGLNAKVEYPEKFEKEYLKKEKKAIKKIRQKTKKGAAHSSVGDMNANEFEIQEQESVILPSSQASSECTLPNMQLSPVRQHSATRQSSPPPSPHTPPGLPHNFCVSERVSTQSPSCTSFCSEDQHPCPPSLSEPCSTRTLTGEDLHPSANDIKNLIEPVSSESRTTVQAKLQEAIEGGTKLSYESLVALLENHPWEERKETFEEPDEYDYYDDYEESVIEQHNNQPEVMK